MAFFKRHPIALFMCLYVMLFALTIAINFPGRANPDTISMLFKSWTGADISDWHAPFIAHTYGILGSVFGYPAGALVIQSALMLLWPAAVYTSLLLPRDEKAVSWKLVAVWTLVTMALAALAGEIVKDVLLVSFLSALMFLITGICKQGHFRLGGWHVAAAFACLLAISLIRTPNLLVIAATAIVFVVFYAAPGQRSALSVKLVALIASLLFAIFVVKNHVIPARAAYPEAAVVIFDLAGIIAHSSPDTAASILPAAQQAGKSVTDCYTPKHANPMIWGPCHHIWIAARKTDQLRVANWLKQIANHPVAYLKHRAKHLLHMLTNSQSYNELTLPYPPAFTYTTNHANYVHNVPKRMHEQLQLWEPSLAFHPFGYVANVVFMNASGSPLIWIVVLAVLAWAAWKVPSRGTGRFLPAIAWAGIGNAVLFAIVGPADDGRYLLPTMFCAIAAMTVWVQHFNDRPCSPVSQPPAAT